MSQNFLEIKDVTFAASKKNKVNNVSFNLKKEGEIICLLGPSGIGKTTILRTIAGLEKVESGKIILKGKTISSTDFHLEPENRNIALSFQENCLFPHYNVVDNIKFGADRNKDKKFNFSVYDLINLLHLEELQQKYISLLEYKNPTNELFWSAIKNPISFLFFITTFSSP